MSKLWSNNGQINLEYQRKRAKALLHRLKAGTEVQKLDLLHKLNPNTQITLASAQRLIALELGFDSWPKLKKHVDSIEFVARHPNFVADDEANTVHWRCGNDIEHTLRLAGFKGTFRMLADPLCMGPVVALAGSDYIRTRSQFIAQAFQLQVSEVTHRMAQEYADLKQIGDAAQAVLWCEADAYDQLFLIHVLASLKKVPRKLELIEIDQMPGVSRFIGIGQLSPDVLAWLWPQRRKVGEDAIILARRAWQAYCSDSPVKLAQLAHQSHACLPLLAPAMRRQLQELPNIHNGLSLTEQLSLAYVAEAGQTSFGSIFSELMAKREPLPFLGDTMYEALLRPLINTKNPLLIESETQLEWPRRLLHLTPLGHKVIGGQAYWPDYASSERWIGGVCIAPGQAHWTIDDNGQPAWRG
ncbi:DUF1835 domain-containing protein [Advenella incenata]|jgi:hypothetical protein